MDTEKSSEKAEHLTRREFVTVATTLAAGTLAVAACAPLNETALLQKKEMAAPTNKQVSNETFSDHAEPYVAVHPDNPLNLLGVCMVTDTAGKGPESTLATYVSLDGGANWQNNGALTMPPNTLISNDPTVAFNKAGLSFVCATARQGGLDREQERRICVWRSEDGGRHFSEPITAFKSDRFDHPWMATDPTSGHLYIVWAGQPQLKRLGFTRSRDGGNSFEEARLVTPEKNIVITGPVVAVGANGVVAAIYGAPSPEAYSSGKKTSGGKQRQEIAGPIEVVCSTDQGQTFGKPIVLGQGVLEIEVPGGDVNLISAATIAASSQHDALYAVFLTHQAGADFSQIVLSASYDRGQTWSKATPITPANEQVMYFQPQIVVDEEGRVALSAFTLKQNHVSVVLFVSEPGSTRFGSPLLVSDSAFDPTSGTASGGGKHGSWWIGDYQGLVSTPNSFIPFWNDARTGKLELFTAIVPKP